MSVKSRALATLAAALVVVLLATNLPAARLTMALAICLLLPGLGWARRRRFGDLGDTVALAIVLSICMTVAVGTAMVLSGYWSPGWGLAVLAGIGLAGFVPARLLLDRAGAVVRLRIAGFADGGRPGRVGSPAGQVGSPAGPGSKQRSGGPAPQSP
jgi:hypothetical protein